jgi:hypothetical protein
MKDVTITSLPEFHEAVQSWSARHPIYRGHNSSKFKLLSKFGRAMERDTKNDLKCEKNTLREFKRRARPYLDYSPADDWEWLALAQHHGLHTRLMDWTKNPLVAGYFAALMHKPNDDAHIYVLDEFALPRTDRSTSPFDIKGAVLFRPDHTTARITAQAGLFTVQPYPVEALAVPGMERWTIKAALLTRLMLMVQTYGVNHATVFPGLEGLCRDIDEWHVYATTYF